MKRSDGSLPGHRWLFMNRVRDYVAYIAVALLIVVSLSAFAIGYSLRRDCSNIDEREFKLFGYWLTTRAGMSKDECPQP